jgi:hypothetical protein
MVQCKECEFFTRDEATGRIMLACDPFQTIKEPACLEKWQLLRLDSLLQSYHTTLRLNQKFAPMQEKMFEFLKREMNDADDSDSWKRSDDDQENPSDDDQQDKDDWQ